MFLCSTSEKFNSAFGFSTEKRLDVEEKVGEERLGKKEVSSNLGGTLITMLIIIVLGVLLLLLLIYLSR